METVIDEIGIKNKCQIFTPEEIVGKMLKCAHYNKGLFGKKVLENSCGDGRILIQIVNKYIEDARENHLSDSVIKKGLEEDIVAYEIDEIQVEKCRTNLSNIALSYGLKSINWKIHCKDFLQASINDKYDFIIGNPPYIAYPNLKESMRKYVRDNFKTCKKGKFDYCYAFIEKSYDLLTDRGTMVYIIPSNIFKNVFASDVRLLIKKELELIIDYPDEKVFQNVLVSPAIVKITKGIAHSNLCYILCDHEVEQETIVSKSQLEDKWVFSVPNNTSGIKVGDYFRVSSSIATLLNEAFVIRNCVFDDKYCYFGKVRLEKNIVKKAASPKSKKNNTDEYIIFPYYYDLDGAVKIYSEQQMNASFPLTMSYLKKYKEKLEKRASDKHAVWYGYGRSQALQNANREMILISSVISDSTKAYLLSEDEIPYSGLYIIRTGNMSLEILLKYLNTQNFINHIQNVGVCVNGQSRRITPDDIKNYVFETK